MLNLYNQLKIKILIVFNKNNFTFEKLVSLNIKKTLTSSSSNLHTLPEDLTKQIYPIVLPYNLASCYYGPSITPVYPT